MSVDAALKEAHALCLAQQIVTAATLLPASGKDFVLGVVTCVR